MMIKGGPSEKGIFRSSQRKGPPFRMASTEALKRENGSSWSREAGAWE